MEVRYDPHFRLGSDMGIRSEPLSPVHRFWTSAVGQGLC